MNAHDPIFVAGHRGLVGSAIVRRLQRAGCESLVLRTRGELDLTDREAVERFFAAERPRVVVLAAAKVGGIVANNTQPADFITENLLMQSNVISAAHRHGVERLLFLGSSCIYPRDCPQPIREEYLLTGKLEPTNEPYAVAKIAGIKMCESFNRQHGTDFRCAMPTNIYGPGDNYHPTNSHVVPGLIRRFHEAKQSGATEVSVWGTGTPRRELMHVDDLADACVHILGLDKASWSAETAPTRCHVNVGTGQDISIADLAHAIAGAVGYKGRIRFDPSYPDGTPRKLLDVERLQRLGWQSRIGLTEGLQGTYEHFLGDPTR